MEKYLRELGGSKPVLNKAKKLEKLAGIICPEKIESFFVSEYSKKDGQRVFENLWFFSNKYFLESKRLMSYEFDLDITCVYGNIDWIEITYDHYDPSKPDKTTDDSRLRIEGSSGIITFTFKASKENCQKLWSIYLKHIKPNLTEFVERE